MKSVKVTLFAVGAIAASCAAALAMPVAGTHDGFSAGAELGASISGGLAGAADVNYGLKTNLLQSPYTDIEGDVLSTDRHGRDYLVTGGVRQPIPISGAVPISVEGGISYLGGSDLISSSTGGFIGGRASFGQHGATGINVMARYHTEAGGFAQLGGGLTGPIGKGSGLFYQADYYHLTSSHDAPNTDTFLIGVRWSGR